MNIDDQIEYEIISLPRANTINRIQYSDIDKTWQVEVWDQVQFQYKYHVLEKIEENQ